MKRSRPSAGFSLVEAMIALAITALTMTVGMSLMAQQSDISRRVAAHLEATRAIEGTLEKIRAGTLPLTSGPVRSPVSSEQAEALVLWLEVEAMNDPPGLTEVVVEARYVSGPKTLSRSIRTMVWRTP